MPIKPENKALYPANWTEISYRIRQRAHNRCEWCGVENMTIIHRFHSDKALWITGDQWQRLPSTEKLLWGNEIKVILTVAHLDHNPANCADDNLKALCQKCHLTYDAQHHTVNAKKTRRQKRLDEIESSGQLDLFGDVKPKHNYD